MKSTVSQQRKIQILQIVSLLQIK